MQTKEEIELILETINTLGKLNRDDEKEAITTTAETLQRLLMRCDKVGLELSDRAVNQLAYEILNKDKSNICINDIHNTAELLHWEEYINRFETFINCICDTYNSTITTKN